MRLNFGCRPPASVWIISPKTVPILAGLRDAAVLLPIPASVADSGPVLPIPVYTPNPPLEVKP